MTLTYEYGNNLYINLTNRCCNRCNFCLRNNSNGSLYADNLWFDGKEPEKEDFLLDLNNRDLSKYEEIVFCGYGEPACRWDDMIWLCDKIREIGSFKIRLNTNGQASLIAGRDVTPETKGRFDIISVSLNSSTEDGYDAVCHSDYGLYAFSEILRFTKGCVREIPRVIMTVVDTMDEAEINECRKVCESLNAEFRVRKHIKE